MLTEVDLLPEPMHSFWDMSKVSILCVGGKKPGTFPNVSIGQVVRVLHWKAEGGQLTEQIILFC